MSHAKKLPFVGLPITLPGYFIGIKGRRFLVARWRGYRARTVVFNVDGDRWTLVYQFKKPLSKKAMIAKLTQKIAG